MIEGINAAGPYSPDQVRAMQGQFQRQIRLDPDLGVIVFDNVRLDSAGGRGKFIRSAFVESFVTNAEVVLASPGAGEAVALANKFVVVLNTNDGSLSQDILNRPNALGESASGDVIADAQLAATNAAANGGAVIAFTNPGGVRTDVVRKEDGAVTYADLFASQPFRNQLVTLTLSGKQIKDMLEQQWLDPKRPRILQVSKGFAYAWDGSKPDGERVIAERMSLDGQKIGPAANYRVTVNNFLSVGGDGFTVLREGKAPQIGVYDIDALHTYFKANSPVGPTAANRIVRVN
jgi:5'-nucleotidase